MFDIDDWDSKCRIEAFEDGYIDRVLIVLSNDQMYVKVIIWPWMEDHHSSVHIAQHQWHSSNS